MDDVLPWAIGFTVSVIFGGLGAEGASMFIWWWCEIKEEKQRKKISPILTGVIERTLFTLFIALSPPIFLPATIPAMMGWLALKLAANWNHGTQKIPGSSPAAGNQPAAGPQEASGDEGEYIRMRALNAILVGLVSLAFAYAGGLICLYQWWEQLYTFPSAPK